MIKSNELRIGNYLYNPVQRINFKIDSRVIHSISNDEKRTYRNENYDYQPIPLTEEIAFKLSYECLVEMACRFTEDSKYRIEITSQELKKLSVHEAQNLYFALTNKELEIKL